MSIDFKIQNRCDHYINWERLSYEINQQVVYPSLLVAAVASFSIRKNNQTVDPSEYVVSRNDGFDSNIHPFMVFFDKKNRLWEPLLEARYTTLSNFCPKCENVKTLDDFSIAQTGDYNVLDAESLLVQNVEKYIITVVGSNYFHPWLGTSLLSLISTKIMDKEVLQAQISDQISQVLEKLRRIQSQLQNTGRTVDPGELLGKVLSITVNSTTDPTLYSVTVNFTAQSGRSLMFTQLLEFPGFRERRAFQ